MARRQILTASKQLQLPAFTSRAIGTAESADACFSMTDRSSSYSADRRDADAAAIVKGYAEGLKQVYRVEPLPEELRTLLDELEASERKAAG